VVAAEATGLSCRAAAARFGVGVATAIRWVEKYRREGTVCAKRQGGDRRPDRIEAYRSAIMDAVAAEPDITLAELQTMLSKRGETFGIGTIWRFFDRHGMTFKKRPRMRRSKAARTS
jgi:transposase